MIYSRMDSFKNWFETNERQLKNGLAFSRSHADHQQICRKIKTPGVRIDNMNTYQVCDKTKEVKSDKSDASR